MRNLLGATVSSFNLLMACSLSMLFPYIYMSIGFYRIFWIYAVEAFLSNTFGLLFISETKGKILKEIESQFSGLNLLSEDDIKGIKKYFCIFRKISKCKYRQKTKYYTRAIEFSINLQ